MVNEQEKGNSNIKEVFTQEEKQQLTNSWKQEIVQSLKNDVRAEVFSWLKKWKIYIIGGLSLASIFGFITMCHFIYKVVEENATKFIASSITTQFAEPKIKSTLQEVAVNQAKEIIENEIRPEIKYIKEESKKEYATLKEEINKIKTEITSFKTYLDNTKLSFNSEYASLAAEVNILKERNKLSELADKAIADGDSASFEQLKNYVKSPIKLELVDAAKAEMLNVKKFYIGMTRIKGVTITYTSPTGQNLTDEEIPTNVLIEDLAKHEDWRVRVKAAQFLKGRKEHGVPDALLNAVSTDTRLDVRKDALDSFESLTGFKRVDVLDYEQATNWWKLNKSKFEENLDKK